MSGSRNRSSNSVTLFPFLAVLVCAMGALIFLLIVTTQQIRTESVARVAAERQEKRKQQPTPEPIVVEPYLPVEISPNIVQKVWHIPEAELPAAPEEILPIPGLVELGLAQAEPILPPPKVLPPPSPEPDPEPIWPAAIAQKPNPVDPNIALREQFAELKKHHEAWLEAIKKKQQSVATLKQQAEQLTASLKTVNTQIESVAKEKSDNRKALTELAQTRTAILGQIAKVDRQIEEAKQRLAGSPTEFQVVPFDGLTGTNYRPIIIECTDAGMRFQPEGVLLTQDDFDGFTLGKNPLLAGSKVLSNYWMKASIKSNGQLPEPYVLLIIRPSGAKYYAARQLLEALDRPFGYELIEENLPLQIPALDPVAAELCRNAVQETLRERDDLKKLLATHGPDILSRNPNYRVIKKPEGGFEVEYAPNGKFPNGGNGSDRGQPETTSPNRGMFGRPETGPNGFPQAAANSRQPGYPGEPGSTAPNQFPNQPGGTGNSFDNKTAEPGRGVGTVPYDPKEPRLLPEDILRRSQGNLPYEGIAGNTNNTTSQGNSTENVGVPPMPSENPDNSTSRNNSQATSSTGTGTNKLGQPNPTTSTTTPRTNANPQPEQITAPNGGNSAPQTPREDSLPSTPSVAGTQRGSSQGGTASGQPSTGVPSSSFEPAMPNFLSLNSQRTLNQAEPYQRRWGLSDPRASIGFEREISVRIEQARLVVGNAYAVPYDTRTTTDQLGAGLLEAIELTARKWGRPPVSFYWVPTIRFELRQDQVPVYQHLNRTAKAWGLETSAEAIEN